MRQQAKAAVRDGIGHVLLPYCPTAWLPWHPLSFANGHAPSAHASEAPSLSGHGTMHTTDGALDGGTPVNPYSLRDFLNAAAARTNALWLLFLSLMAYLAL